MSPFQLTGRTILVAGATGCIGSACCRAVAGLGGELYLTGRTLSALERLRGEFQAKGANARFLRAELSEADEVEQLAQDLPCLDGVVFAAGQAPLMPLRLASDDALVSSYKINFEAAARLIRLLSQHGRIRKGASLVFIASIAASRGASAYSLYAGTKGALVAWARSLAVELARLKIRVNTVSPGLVQSTMADDLSRKMAAGTYEAYKARYPLGIGTPDDVAWAVCYLLSPAASWITGVDLVVDGGISAT